MKESLESLILPTSWSVFRTGQFTAALAGNRGLIHYLRPVKLPLSILGLAPGRREETQ